MIELIRKRPVGILVKPSATMLYAFLSGFALARKDDNTGDYDFLAGFGNYVHERFRITSTQSWAQIIEFFSGTEADELTLFFKLLDEYVAKKATKRKKVS
jgi:hypothetical protein